jgi:multiple sugar transport system substrate-binding protein
MRRTTIGAGIASLAITLAVTACGSTPVTQSSGSGSLTDTGPITFATAADPGGGTGQIVAAWNKAHPDQKVTIIELSTTSDEYHSSLAQSFGAKSDRFDVIRSNSVWTPEFAARGWINQIPAGSIDTSGMLAAPVKTGQYNGKTYAIPWFTDAGVFYYRKDLVATPPSTWSQLQADCAVATSHHMTCYTGQFAQYDGLTVNVVEAIDSAGGSILNSDGTKATVTTAAARTGLSFLINGFRDGTIAKESITYQEEDSRKAFESGQVLFLRNWPYVYNLAGTAGAGNNVVGKVGIAAIPGLNGPGKPALGGWDLAISSFSKHKKTALDFISYLTSAAQQRILLTKTGLSPVVSSLYDDPGLLTTYPYLAALKRALQNAVPLPQTPNWTGLSLAVQKAVYPILQSGGSVDDGLKQMQSAIEVALKQS